jgi:hypothetical protein
MRRLAGPDDSNGARSSERFRRTDFGRLEIAVTFADPKAYNEAAP